MLIYLLMWQKLDCSVIFPPLNYLTVPNFVTTSEQLFSHEPETKYFLQYTQIIGKADFTLCLYFSKVSKWNLGT